MNEIVKSMGQLHVYLALSPLTPFCILACRFHYSARVLLLSLSSHRLCHSPAYSLCLHAFVPFVSSHSFPFVKSQHPVMFRTSSCFCCSFFFFFFFLCSLLPFCPFFLLTPRTPEHAWQRNAFNSNQQTRALDNKERTRKYSLACNRFGKQLTSTTIINLSSNVTMQQRLASSTYSTATNKRATIKIFFQN